MIFDLYYLFLSAAHPHFLNRRVAPPRLLFLLSICVCLLLFRTLCVSQILAHPAVKAVVSHCGMGSAQEALLFGKPLLCLPMLADQEVWAFSCRVAQLVSCGGRGGSKVGDWGGVGRLRGAAALYQMRGRAIDSVRKARNASQYSCRGTHCAYKFRCMSMAQTVLAL